MPGSRPTPPGPIEHDEDGDPLPQPAETSDLADLIQLLEYARLKDFQVGPVVRVGKIQVQVRDIRQLRKVRDLLGKDADPQPEPSIGEMVGVPEYTPGD